MFEPMYAAIAAALLFYLIIPLTGGLITRGRWRRFRALVSESLNRPYLGYRVVDQAINEGRLGRFKLFGGVQAMQESDCVWLKAQKIGLENPASVGVDLRRANIYILPNVGDSRRPAEGRGFLLGGLNEYPGQPERYSWKNLPMMRSGAKVFVSGCVYRHKSGCRFSAGRGEPLLVVIYSGGEESLASRLVQQGRHRNEYWNRVTPMSLGLGALCMALIFFSFLGRPLIRQILLLTTQIAFFPLSVFLPPGLGLVVAYRRLWARARQLREERDMALLPASILPPKSDEVVLHTGELYRRAFFRDQASLAGTPIDLRGIKEPLAAREEGLSCFGVANGLGQGAEEPLHCSRDPMIECVAIPGSPESFSRRCSLVARLYTLLSALCLFLAGILNNVLIFALFRIFLR